MKLETDEDYAKIREMAHNIIDSGPRTAWNTSVAAK